MINIIRRILWNKYENVELDGFISGFADCIVILLLILVVI